jgi:hypothetical protein
MMTLNAFDNITRFRIINAIAVYFGLNLLVPIINDLRGELLSSSVIAFIMIGLTLSVKLNKYITSFSISQVYKMGNVFHLLLTFSTFLYFYNPLYFIYVNASLGIIEIAIFTSYSIQLDEYLANKFPYQVAKFKIFVNSKKADATLSGLGITAVLTVIAPIEWVFILFIVYNTIFSGWLIWNWNFYDKELK